MKRYRKYAVLNLIIIIALSMCSILSFVKYRNNVDRIIEEKVHDDLEKYTDQSVELVNYIIDDYFRQLDILAELCSNSSSDTQITLLETLNKMNAERSYVDFAIVNRDGILYDGTKTQDIKEEKYFQHALQGERYMSKISRDLNNPVDYIVISIPLLIDGEIDGVIASRYEIEQFMDLVSNTQFEGNGATMIMDNDGTMVSGHEGMENYKNFYEALSVPEFHYDEEHVIDTFKTNVENGKSGFFRYTGPNNKYRYLYYQPINEDGWTMISLVMAESLQNQYDAITQQSYSLMIVNIFNFTCIIFFLWRLYRKLKQASYENQYDPLTKTYNKICAKTICESYLNNSGKEKQHACFFLDIDNFKSINDTYGHACGDSMILEFSRVLKTIFRGSDIVSRFGGDEFFIFMKETADRSMIEQKAKEIGKALSHHEPSATISIGIALYPQDGNTYAKLQKHADEALYQAKKHQKGTYVFYQSIKKNPQASKDERSIHF